MNSNERKCSVEDYFTVGFKRTLLIRFGKYVPCVYVPDWIVVTTINSFVCMGFQVPYPH